MWNALSTHLEECQREDETNFAKGFHFFFSFFANFFQTAPKAGAWIYKRASLSFHGARRVLIDAKILKKGGWKTFCFLASLFVPSSTYRTRIKFLHVSAAAIRRRSFEREPSSVTGNGQKWVAELLVCVCGGVCSHANQSASLFRRKKETKKKAHLPD
jgi:uncharacterized membrane protein